MKQALWIIRYYWVFYAWPTFWPR